MANEFSKSTGAAVSMINGVIQYGSQISFSIGNGTGEDLNLVEFVVRDDDQTVVQTSDPADLNGGVLASGESYGLTITIRSSGVTVPLKLSYILEDPVTGVQYSVDYTYDM